MANINIGGRLHSTATGNIVAGANEILDDNKNKKQSVVNQEVDETLANHNSRINALSEQNYITVEATAETANVATLINSTGHGEELNTIYRVGKWDGTQYTTDAYCEYSYDETTSSYKLLHKLNYGIDDAPTSNSDNLVKSGGIKTYVDNHVSVSKNTITIGGDSHEVAIDKVVIVPGINLFDKNAKGITIGKYIYSDGRELANASYNISDYISVNEQTAYHLSDINDASPSSSSNACFGFYKADKTFISTVAGNVTNITTPQDCAYVRFSYSVDKTRIMMNIGSNRALYKEYSDIGSYVANINETISMMIAESVFGENEILPCKTINTSGALINATNEYRLAKFQIVDAGKYIVSIGKGTNTISALVRYSDDSYTTPSEIIVGKNESGFVDILELSVGYYAISWAEVSKQKSFVTNESMLIALWGDLNYKNELVNNIYDKQKDILSYTYIDNSGNIAIAGYNYHTIKFQITNAGYYYIKSGENPGRPTLVKYTDSTYSTVSSVIESSSNIDKVLNLSIGYYAICHSPDYTNEVIITNVNFVIKTIQGQNIYGNINTKTVIRNLFGVNNILDHTRILATGEFQTVYGNYKTYKIHIESDGWYFLQSGQNSYSNPELCKYTDGTYGTLSAIIIDDKAGVGVSSRITGLYYLESGYYALCHSNSYLDDVIFTKYNGVISYLDDSIKATFNTIDSSYPGVIVRGTSARTTGGINLKSGYSNRVSLDNGFVCAHYRIAIKFNCTNDVAMVVGYSVDNYKTLSNHFKVIGGSTNKFYYYESENDSSPAEHEIGFALNINEEYLFVLTWNNDSGKFTLELYGQFNEYANWEVLASPGPIPMFYTESDDTFVESFQLSPQCYYDLNNAKIGVFGHSFVQASTMRGEGMQYSFVGLLANTLGEDKVLNFGLGGENYYNGLSKLNNELPFVANTEYALVYLGVNDVFGGLTGAEIIQRAENFVAMFKKKYNIIPILFTCQPSVPGNTLAGAYSGVQQAALDYNAWLRSSEYLYVDVEQAFVDVNVKITTPTNSNIKTALFFADGVHPNIDGHLAIFNRIKMDCPYLF